MTGFLGRLRGKKVHPGDRQLIQHMLDAGQQLASRPRETTHYLLFRDEATARRAAVDAAGHGFRTEVTAPGDGIDVWRALAHHTIIVDEDAISAARVSLTAIAERAGGEYDGWDMYADEALDQMRPT